MEQHGIICGQGHAQAFVQELSERVLWVFQEQAVVAEWRHGDWDLSQVVQVLQNWALWEYEVQWKSLTGAGRKDDIDSAVFCCGSVAFAHASAKLKDATKNKSVASFFLWSY